MYSQIQLQAPLPSAAERPMTAAQRDTFERDGLLVVPAALASDEVDYFAAALDRVYASEQAAGHVPAGGPMHLLSAVAHCPEALGLIDHPATFPLVWSVLGWNVHIYHSHLDVHPQAADQPYRFEWHQDGGRQNRELDGEPRPRMSVKVGFWLSDVSQPGRGNFKIVPRSHRSNRIDGPPRRDIRWPEPADATEVCVRAGDAVFFDRRLWHCRSTNRSPVTRKAMFFGYTLRWIVGRDERGPQPPADGLSPVRSQLLGWLGQQSGDHRWGHEPESTPLYRYLADRGMLAHDNPPLRP